MDVVWDVVERLGRQPRRNWQRDDARVSSAPPPVWAEPLGGLVFEMAGVLYDDTIWRRWLLQLLARLGLQTQYATFYRVFEREYLPEVHCGRRDYWDALREYLTAVGLSRGQINEVEIAGRSRRLQCEMEIRPLPGVVATLAKLGAAGVPAVILSNSSYRADDLRRRLRLLGLSERFTHVLGSQDLQHCKPAPECYRAALDALQFPAREVGFVAREATDLQGAAAADMVTIAINHVADAWANIYLERFEHLLAAVRFRSPQKLAG